MAAHTAAASWLHLELALCCIVFAVFTASPPQQSAHALPIQIPHLDQCVLATDKSLTTPVVTIHPNCCIPVPVRTVPFDIRKYPQKRVRRQANLVDAPYIAKYNRAYELMKALPDDDPRGFHVQANFHCAFCNFAYKQKFHPSVPLQMHFSWLFLPWHRMYLYFHERILASLVGDPNFSLVYWNWADQKYGGNVMPAMFIDQRNGALYDAKRNQANLPPTLVKLVSSTNGSNDVIIKANLNAVHSSVVTATTAELFLGGEYVEGTDLSNSTVINAPLAGRIESGVHNSVHYWTGDPRQPVRQDMGTFSSAGRDPIFYSHHSNVDRLWDMWKYHLPGGPRFDSNNVEFLNAEFIFYDEHKQAVRVLVRDALSNPKLGISYETARSDPDWIYYSPNATTSGSAVPNARALGVSLVSSYPTNGVTPLGERLAAIVKTPTMASTASASDSTEVLVIQGLRAKRDRFTSLRAFVNLPAADTSTDVSSAEYLGAFNIIPVTGTDHVDLLATVKFEIGDNLRRLALTKEQEVVVTLVVTGEVQPMTIEGLLIDYE